MAATAAVDKMSVAAGAAALAQLNELDPMANEKVEAEIPDELKEQPPPESLFAMDKRMEEILSDMRALEAIRHKDYQNTSGRADRLAAFPGLSVMEKYKQIRTERVERIVRKEMPPRLKSTSKLIAEEVDNYWKIDADFAHTPLLVTLIQFFKDKAAFILEQNSLLLSRWSRFCRSSHDIANFYPVFQRYQEWLQSEYSDTVERYERLSEAYDSELRRARLEEAKAEAERIERERHGLVGIGRKGNTKANAPSTKAAPALESEPAGATSAGAAEFASNPLGPAELGLDPQFNVGDMTVYLRWNITALAGRKHTEIFLQRAKMLVHSDRVQFIKDYRLITNVKASQGGLETLNILDGINKYGGWWSTTDIMLQVTDTASCSYIENPPCKRPKIEDFLTEFDLLVAHWTLDTPISREDGRPFAYEVDSKFREVFTRQAAESSFPPYESSGSADGPEPGGSAGDARTNTSGSAPGTAGNAPSEPKVSMAALAGLLGHPAYRNLNVPRLLYADWTTELEFFPDHEEWVESQQDALGQLQDIDFELRYEHDLIITNEFETIMSKLREAARRIHEDSQTIGSGSGNASTSRPASGRPQKQERQEEQPPDNGPESIVMSSSTSIGQPFQLGMKVPDPRDMELPKDFRVLDGKKHAYGILLRNSEAQIKVEQASSGEGAHARQPVGPTVAQMFSEHEILCSLQLRLIRIRQIRSTLLSQLNFFRSVEKRLNCDWKRTKSRVFADITDPVKPKDRSETVLATCADITHMWHQQDLFDIPDPGRDRGAGDGSANPGRSDTGSEDIRLLINGQIYVKDYKGVNIIYDVAVDDMKRLEASLLKMATIYINAGRAVYDGKESSETSMSAMDDERNYGESMRGRISERKAEFLQFVEGRYTFLNPDMDRTQLLLELYDHEVKYQFAKIEAINAYMEVYEHTQDPPRIRQVAQVVTNLIHARPHYELKSTYFSRGYALSTRTLQIQAEVVISMVKEGLQRNREWFKRYFGRIDPTAARQTSESDLEDERKIGDNSSDPADLMSGFKKTFESPIPAGLPPREDSEKQTITMHNASVILNMTEIVPALDSIADIYEIAKTVSCDLERTVEDLHRQGVALGLPEVKSGSQKVNRQAVECAVWKTMHANWNNLSDSRFSVPLPRGRRLIGRLDTEIWMENPLVLDMLLMDHYTSYGKRDTGQGLRIHVAAMTPFSDPDFRSRGLELCQRFGKLLVLKERLYYSWLTTEHWRRTYEAQFPQFMVNKLAYTGRLNSLRFDLPDMADNTAVEEEYDDDHSELIATDVGNDEEEKDPTLQATKTSLRFGPLAVAELDESIAAAITVPTITSAFDLSTISGINLALAAEGLSQLRFSLKIQLLEKAWHAGAVELHHYLLAEAHSKLMAEGPPVKIDKNKSGHGGRRSPQRYSDAQNAQVIDVDYRLLVTSVVPRKKALRKMMLAEYNREFKTRSARSDISDAEREAALNKIKMNLYEWYYMNMLEVAQEECERAAYAKTMTELRNDVLRTTFGRLLFRPSKVKRHFDYFANQDKGVTETDFDPSQLNMDGVTTQDVFLSDAGTNMRICKLWFLPSITEIVMSTNFQDKSGKGNLDYAQKVFKNSGNFERAWNVQSMILDLFMFVSVYAHMLQDNRRYAVQVRQVREADYVVNTIGAMKKDISYQGQQADVNRVEQYLAAKWQLWILKLKLALGSSTYTIAMNLMPHAHGQLLDYFRKLSQKENPDDLPKFRSLIRLSNVDFLARQTPYPSPYIFARLDINAKRICDKKVTELEECLDEFLQATMLNFGENADEINKSQSDFLLTGLKLLALRRHFLKSLIPGGVVQREDQLDEFFRMYKMKVLVPAVRLYHKQGAKGNASIPLLLRDSMVTATVDFDFNRIAQALFDKCQVTVLQTEIMRECTLQLIRLARSHHDHLADERTGRLFKVYDSIDVPSLTGHKSFAYRLGEEDYAAKTGIINEFVRDLWKANVAYLKEVQEGPKAGSKTAKTPAQVAASVTANMALDPTRVFACTKDALSNTVTRLALQITKWHEKRKAEQDHFMSTLMGRMLDMIKNGERLVKFLAQEKKELLESYKRDVRLVAFQLSSDLHAEFASTTVELADLRKQRRTDERRIRNRILDEYDDLVQELVMEINVLRNRFSEYRVNTFQEVMSIMSEAKKEELHVVLNNEEMPSSMKESARWMIKHEEEAQALRQENHELKMTLLKVRSMYIIKEQSLRSVYEKKTRKLSEGSKNAEEKLWDSYREAEARESTLRKQLTKAQKTLSLREAENDTLQRHLREEQQRVRQLTPIKDRAASAAGRRYGETESSRIAELQEKLSRYEGLKIETVLKQLEEKTRQLEQVTDDQRKSGGMAGGMAGGRQTHGHHHHRRAVSARLARPPMVIKASGPRRKGLGPYSDYKEYEPPTAEEESLSGPGDKIEKHLNHHLVSKMNSLALQNKMLRNMLADCGIEIPDAEPVPDTDDEDQVDKVSVEGELREEAPSEVRKSVMWQDQQLEQTSAEKEPMARKPPRIAHSAPPGGRSHASRPVQSPLGDSDRRFRPPRAREPPTTDSERTVTVDIPTGPAPSQPRTDGPLDVRDTGPVRAYRPMSALETSHTIRQSMSLLPPRPTSAPDMFIPSVLRTSTPPPLVGLQSRPTSRPSTPRSHGSRPSTAQSNSSRGPNLDLRMSGSSPRPTTPRTPR
ncbi:hypothetical protein HDU90_008015 [Geranomyces variabilis]|nr:hypothetical protein HDU90_008015 [Geranomyces variabilis]